MAQLPTKNAPSWFRVLAAPLPLALGVAALLVGVITARSATTIVALVIFAYLGGLALTALLSRPIKIGVSSIDPFAVGEPWRRFVQSALATEKRFNEALRASSPGPVQDRLLSVQPSVRTGVEECWQAARQAQEVSQARLKLDGWVLKTRYDRLVSEGNHDAAASTAAQLDSLKRLDGLIAEAKAALEAQTAKLALAVTTASEMNVANSRPDEATQVQSSLEQVADELEALRRALGDTSITDIAE